MKGVIGLVLVAAISAPLARAADRPSVLGLVARAELWTQACLGRGLTLAERRAVAAGTAVDEVAGDDLTGVRCAAATPAGPAAARLAGAWFKTPEALEGTIVHAFGLALTAEERWTFLHGTHALLGGASPAGLGATLDEPNELYVMAAANLSAWLADRLIAREAELGSDDYVFEGLGLDPEDADGCYDDPARDWCDARDGIAIGDFASGRLDPQALTPADRKRLKHNVRDIGEFLLADTGPGVGGAALGGRDVPTFLIDDVLLPALGEAPVSEETERAAWAQVVDAVLLSGAFFVEGVHP